ncbi:tRNA (adenosine(37)-N6)-dimethylallyltransferase MiaA [Prolixibacteraceae bacterium JC049]|nr:tRNA (adenosine(37)-N6)-dimethylallyltransferase MiaA [Prolixibacteraceae bacterium JC049]
MENYLIVILGPTGVGKTDLSIDIAKKYNTDIVSSDSRQVYKELNIGTAVPEPHYLEQVKHHFIQHLSVLDYYSASRFEESAMELLTELFKSKQAVVVSGGSMLYIDSLCNGIDELPTVDPELRKELIERFENEGLEPLRRELKHLDPAYYDKVDLKNPKRILHALEICYMTGKPFTELRTNIKKERPFKIIKLGLNRDREELYERINLRVDLMLEQGLEEEARSVYQHKANNSLNTVGYKELFDYFDGTIDKEEAIRLIKRNSRRYARKQLSWFRRDDSVNWFHPEESEKIFDFLDKEIKNT